ncbi:GntR family transcriptional regulator [uncultured Anaerococcus sp.]|uniref:GntR family transcriptional regulator n=1 Tax=uncultured Anaerococcus sp. TaxID=293428 RepID=UPI0025EA1839|nr:GntR family transcriptional regulator [uncultured Anaerococcus sp.]
MDNNKLIFEQVAEIVENQILDGLLEADEKSPSTTDFANTYAINPATARKGLNILVNEGILYKKRGLGMFVTDNAKEIIKSKRKKEYINNILPNLIKNMKMLGITKEDLIKEIENLYQKELDND